MRISKFTFVLGAAALALAGCNGNGTEQPAVPTQMTIEVSDFSFLGAPTEIEGGALDVTLRNSGQVTHEAAFIRLEEGRTREDFQRDFPPILEGGPIPDYFLDFTGIGDVEAGDTLTSTFTLPEGTYLLVCALTEAPGEEEEGPPHYELGMIQDVTVTAGTSELPTADGTVVARDYSFDLPSLSAGTQTLVFRNEGPRQAHHAIFFEFPEGVDEDGARAAFQAFAEAGEGPPPEGTPEPEVTGSSFIFTPGQGGTFDVELTSGRAYLVACFIQDRTGGPPHAFGHGMIETVTVQ